MKIISVESNTIYQSNSLSRGIQTFTSFLSDKDKFIFLEDHLNRLLQGADFLFPTMKWLNKKHDIEAFLQTEFVSSHYYRLTIFDDQILFTKKPHEPKEPFLNVVKAKSMKIKSIIPAYVKRADYMLADLEIKNSKVDDIIFFDDKGNLAEASSSNVFVVLDEQTYLTPKSSSIVLDGVIRKKLIEFLKLQGKAVQECDISQAELESAREIWLTNSVQGVRLVDSFEKQIMFKEKSIYQSMCHKFGRFGEKFNHE